MYGTVPGRWLRLFLLGILTALLAFDWIGEDGVHHDAIEGLFSSPTLVAALVPIPLAPAASAATPRAPTGAG